ncbi:MAG: hypothetical protein WBA63_15720 [Thermomicrobiales bacterium]
MRAIVRSFSAIMLVFGMLASSLVPVFAQDEPTVAPTDVVQPTEIVQPTEEIQPTEVVQPTDIVEPTEEVQPTAPEVVEPTGTEDGDVEAAANFSGFLVLTTSDGGVIPSGSTYTVTNITGGGSTVVFSAPLFWDWASPATLPIVPIPPLPKNAQIRVDVSAEGYQPFSQQYTLGDILFFISGTLQKEPEKAPVDIVITMSDGGLIPDGMTWSFQQDDYTEIESGAVPSGSASGWTVSLTNPVPEGNYVLLVRTPDNLYFYFYVVVVSLPSTTLTVNFDRMTAVNIEISMSDGGLLPDGLMWSFEQGDYTEIDGGTVPDGSASGWTVSLADPVPAGSYVLLVRTPDNLYYYFYVVVVAGDTTTLPVVFDRVQGDVTATFVTSDGGDVPAGTTWTITDESSNVVQSGTLSAPIPNGGLLPNTNPLAYGNYLLTVDADGYLPYATGFVVDAASIAFDIELQEVPPTTGTVNLTVTTSDGGAIPTGTIITIGGVSYVVSDLGEVSAADAASGTVFVFTDVPAGMQPITVTNAAPYADATGEVEVEAGSTVDAAIVLQRTVEPSPTVTPSPTVSPTSAPAEPTATAQPTQAPAQPTAVPHKPGGKSTISALPNTGQGTATQDGMNTALLALAAALLLAGVAGIVGVRTRRQ